MTNLILGDGEAMGKPIPTGKLHRADDVDSKYYKKIFEEQLQRPRASLDEFDVYRGEFKLGAGTICDDSLCNVELLVKAGCTSSVFPRHFDPPG